MIMLRQIQNINTKNIINSIENENEKMMIGIANSKRIGLGKYGLHPNAALVYNNNNNNNNSNNNKNNNNNYGMAAIIELNPTPMREESWSESSNSRPHRISFITADEDNNNNKKRTVRFASSLATKASTTGENNNAIHILTQEHCEELWHQKDELAAIKQEAKHIIANRKAVLEGSSDDDDDFCSNNDDRENLVGLERFSRQRAVWKRSAIHYVLMAQRQVHRQQRQTQQSNNNVNNQSNEEYIRNVSTRCSGWAKETAVKQGFRDYCAVHDPLASLFSDSDDEFSDSSNDITSSSNSNNNNKGRNYNELIFGDSNNNNSSSRSKRKSISEPKKERQHQTLGDRRVRRRLVQ